MPVSISRVSQQYDNDDSPPVRKLSPITLRRFALWTAFFWGGTVVWATLFYFGVLSFRVSAKISLYGISIWLNGWLLSLIPQKGESRSISDIYHDCLSVWLISYAMTNILWEVPWILCSPFVFKNIDDIHDLIDQTGYMRSSPLHMYYWVLSSFGSVDLRTVNHDPTFYTLELYAFVNLLTTAYFFYLNKMRSPLRYLVVVLGCGEPVASTFIFSFTEVVAGMPNMAGGVADTLLALVWTQYQYILYPLYFGFVGTQLLRFDWQYSVKRETDQLRLLSATDA